MFYIRLPEMSISAYIILWAADHSSEITPVGKVLFHSFAIIKAESCSYLWQISGDQKGLMQMKIKRLSSATSWCVWCWLCVKELVQAHMTVQGNTGNTGCLEYFVTKDELPFLYKSETKMTHGHNLFFWIFYGRIFLPSDPVYIKV